MNRLIVGIFLMSTMSALAQNMPPPPPCGEKGVPDNVPCMDLKTHKLMHDKTPIFVPHQDLPQLPPPATSVTIPKIQPSAPATVNKFPVSPPDSHAYAQPNPDVSTPQPDAQDSAMNDEEWNRIAKEKQQEFEGGAALGSAIGNALYLRMERHDINKACFDKGATGWKFPDGETVKCSDWKIIHPRHEHGVPPDITPDLATTLSQICQNKSEFIYMTRSYSCKDWKKHERTVAAGKTDTKIAGHKVTDNGKTNILLMMMEYSRLDSTARPTDKQALTSWRLTKEAYCESSPDGYYRELDGGLGSCGGMARQAYNMMEELRKSISDLQPADNGFAESAVQDAESSWHKMKAIFCQDVPNRKYTDLSGKIQSCAAGE